MYSILIKSVLLLCLCQCLHILVWRIRRPTTYRTWLPVLLVIFVPLAGIGAFWMSRSLTIPGDNSTTTAWIEWLGISLFQIVLSTVYIEGYTAVVAFSPSMEILKALDEQMPQGLPHEKLALPFSEDELIDARVSKLVAAEMIEEENGNLRLAWRGRLIARIVLFYRHLLGLPVGGGG